MRYSVVKTNSGFTLIEMIVVISIIAILSAATVPSFTSAIDNNKLSSATSKLMAELQYTRSEAVKRNSPVTICASTDGATCNTNDWEQGRLVFIDDGAGTPSNEANGVVNGEEILKYFDTSRSGIMINATVFTSPGHVVYFGDGSVNSVGTMVVCDARGTTDSTLVKAVNVSIIGQARKAYDADTSRDSVVNNISGANVVCA